jgi:hypothetical protein
VKTCLLLLTSLNIAWPVLLLAIPLRLKASSDRKTPNTLAKLLIIPALLVAIYVPCYVTQTEQRFFYAAYPFLFGALAIWAETAIENGKQISQLKSPRTRAAIVIIGAVVTMIAGLLAIRDLPKFAGDRAAELAKKMREADLQGPMAGSGSLPGGRAGLYVAFLLNQAWHGDERTPNVEDLKRSGARFAILTRNSPWARAVEESAGFTNLDAKLFSTEAEAEQFPLKVFEIKPAAAD